MNGLFDYLDFETIGSCHRVCPTCIRNSHPDREKLTSWFGPNYLSRDLIFDAIDQAIAMGFRGGVCLSHYNEPTQDERLPEIAHKVRAYSEFSTVHMNTTGDFLTPKMADELDGAFDYIIVTLYMKDPKRSERAAWLPTLLKKTELRIVTDPHHTPTHFTPSYDLPALIKASQGMSCNQPKIRVIINHKRDYLGCCDDVIGNFDLGSFPETSIKDHWFGKQKDLGDLLANPGGRSTLPYCMTCPRGAPWEANEVADAF